MIRYCDCCDKIQFVIVALKNLTDRKITSDKKYDIITCTVCSHSFIDPMPSGEELKNFYPKNYYAHTTFIYTASIKKKLKNCLIRFWYGQFSDNNFIRLIQKQFYSLLKHKINEPPFLPGGKYLDVGCGSGEYLNMIRRFGWEIYGIDFNEDAVRIATNFGLNVKRGSAEKIEYENGYFDVVRVWNVLEHTVSPRKAIFEISRVLKRGGYLIIYVPNFNSVNRKYFSKYWSSLEIPRHCHHFSIKSLESYLNQAGLVINKRLYSGTLFSTIIPTIKIMINERVSIFFILYKAIASVIKKCFNRLKKNYSEEVGICVLAYKK